MAYGAEDIQEQQARMKYLERLYTADQRFRKDHPWHGKFTGLYQGYKDNAKYGLHTRT